MEEIIEGRLFSFLGKDKGEVGEGKGRGNN